MAIWTALLTHAVAAADLVIAAPAFVVGDTWEFAGTDNGKPYRWSREIIEAMPDGRLRVKAARNGKETIELYAATMNFLVGGRLDRPRQLAKYPLAMGAAWRYAVGYDDPNAMSGGEAKVIAQEHITVSAGAFDCLKVETSSAYGYRAASYSAWDSTTRWYCPQVKWIAKEKTASRTSAAFNPAENVGRETDTELIRFTPGKQP